jgi:hypothetical protein
MRTVKALKVYPFRVAAMEKESEKEDACTSAARAGFDIT